MRRNKQVCLDAVHHGDSRVEMNSRRLRSGVLALGRSTREMHSYAKMVELGPMRENKAFNQHTYTPWCRNLAFLASHLTRAHRFTPDLLHIKEHSLQKLSHMHTEVWARRQRTRVT